jgi:hypothetical protein
MPDDGSFGSDYLGASGSFSVKFDQPGTVPIHCSLHPRMKATIIVDPPDGTAAAVLNTATAAHSANAVL